jgi:hypothetical protein
MSRTIPEIPYDVLAVATVIAGKIGLLQPQAAKNAPHTSMVDARALKDNDNSSQTTGPAPPSWELRSCAYNECKNISANDYHSA